MTLGRRKRGRPTLYDRPVRELLREAVDAMPPVFRRADLRAWFREHYPAVRYGTVQMHIAAGVVNTPAHASYSIKVGDLLYKRRDGSFEKYDVERHGPVEQLMKKVDAAPLIVRRNPGRTTDLRGTRHAARNAEIARRISGGEPIEEVADDYGLSPAYVGHLLNTFTFEVADEEQGVGEAPATDTLETSANLVRDLLADFIGIELRTGVLRLTGGLTQRYELVSADERVVGSVLDLMHALPASRWPLISEHVWLLQHLGSQVRKLLVVVGDQRTPGVWLDNLGRLAEDVEFLVVRDNTVIDLRGNA